ncbi:hypothetical protein Vadar_005160 [Vaccinium darrowii]|uniref:Uncharacterized protein n=1 Tax=Vaccinium darrowii TaxID=229202 RepID=A0ACB7XXM6_9ERIC|nr:hypothetical protein Vadar_005160 [Vaccinium darrowii]
MVVDWGPMVVAVAMFILLSPGLLFQVPARARVVEFGNMYTSGISILVHAIIFLGIYTILIIAIGDSELQSSGVSIHVNDFFLILVNMKRKILIHNAFGLVSFLGLFKPVEHK